MPQKARVEINKFTAGLITDASPLTYPENSSAVDINMILNSDGSRQRALGIDYEDDYQIITTTVLNAATQPIAFNFYRWKNVGGDPDKTIICIQIGNEVKFFNGDAIPLSSGLISTINFSTSGINQRFSFAAVDGSLAIASGVNTITIATYNSVSNTLTSTTDIIRVRDFFGVEDFDGTVDLTVGAGVSRRPVGLTNAHLYNLRNQGFGVPRTNGNTESFSDPVGIFRGAHFTTRGREGSPSNADMVVGFLYADANDADDRNSKRYFAVDAVKNPIGSTRAAQGYFIIDILNRGTSRMQQDAFNRTTYPELSYTITSLPGDTTPGGATVVGEFAGRIWFGGFSGEVLGGDTKSPQLSSYICFSQLVNNPTMITQCYQAGDPTSEEEPDILATDGGYIRLNSAYGISGMYNLGKSLMVCASNGIWRIYGGNDSGFDATNYVVEKITDRGVRGPSSIVQVENTLLYWADDGIYWLRQNQFGDWASENQTQQRIQTFYNNIPIEDKVTAIGVYDSFQRKVRWTYQNHLYSVQQQKELILDVNLNAFYERHISQVSETVPVLIGGFNTNVYQLPTVANQVVVGPDMVVVGSDDVINTISIRIDNKELFEVNYVIITQISPTVSYTFGSFSNRQFIDWKTYNGTGVDSPATLVTGTSTGGDSMRYKQIPYLFVQMKRTEDGFETDVNGDLVPTNQSSCTVQSQWDWANSVNSNKWGAPFEAYRYNQVYYPVDVNDLYDTGYSIIETKNKLRGRGRSIGFKFTSSPQKEMHIYGWAMPVTINDAE